MNYTFLGNITDNMSDNPKADIITANDIREDI